MEGGDYGAVVGAGARTDFAGATNQVFAIENVVDGDAEKGVVAIPCDGVSSAAGTVFELGVKGAKAGGVGGAVEVADDDNRSVASAGLFGDSLQGCLVGASGGWGARREGVGVDKVELATLELDECADVGSGVFLVGIDDGVENGVFGIKQNTEVVAAWVFDDVRVAGSERGKGVDPLAAGFLEEEEVGVVFLDEG